VIVCLIVVDVMDTVSVRDGAEVSFPYDIVFHSLPISVPVSDVTFWGLHIESSSTAEAISSPTAI
jgi:hypothetical protein